jgi:hypothetical protein
VDSQRARLLREVLAATGWVESTTRFASTMRRSTRAPGGLLLVGTPQEEPWHLAAHLDDESRFSGIAEIAPTLVRWAPPKDAPAHLAVGLDRIEATTRGETLFVIAPEAAPEQLLERVADARRIGATVLSIDDGDHELDDLVHDRLVVPATGLVVPDEQALLTPAVDFEVVQHLVSVAAGEATRRMSMRDRLSRMLELVSGPAPRR